MTYSFPDLEPVCCSMSSSKCCFLTCIQISQETGKVKAKVFQSCLTLCDPMDSTVHGILKSRTLEWVALPFSTQGLNPGLPHCRRILYQLSHQGSLEAGKVVWYSHHLKNFPQFVVIHTFKAFGIVNKIIQIGDLQNCELQEWPVSVMQACSGRGSYFTQRRLKSTPQICRNDRISCR